MKGTFIALLGAMALAMESTAATTTTIGHWNFNSSPPDASVTSGTAAPSTGTGTASLLGGITAQFAGGSPTDSGTDNSAWSTASYPAVGNANKTAGVQFRVSTRGFSNIVITWYQRVSAGASRYARLQYSINGADYVDSAAVIDMRSNNTFYAQSVSLAAAPGVDDNPNFAFRIVTEFERTAVGAGADSYVTALGGTYSGAGTIRFDQVNVSGNFLNEDNTPPSLVAIPDLSTVENQAIIHSIQLADLETPADQLTVLVGSSNPKLIPVENIVIAGSGLVRQMTITPAADSTGESSVTLTVVDADGSTGSQAFNVEVLPLNAPPVISAIPHQRQIMNLPASAIPFIIGDTETPAESMVISTSCSDATLVGAGGLVVTGTGANRTLTIQPATGTVGTALITVRVTDEGGRSASTSFALMVLPAPGVILYDNFGYLDGSLVTNSARLWETHSGTGGQVKLTGGGIGIGGSQTEDLHTAFPGNPMNTGSVFVSFQATFSSLPTGNDYFAHLNFANSFRARVFPATNQAAPGRFRLAVGNNAATGLGQYPADLSLNTTYTIVIRYEIEASRSALWVNPVSESDAPAMATDTATAAAIGGFSFRNASGIGAMRIDNLMVARTFADVMLTTTDRVALQIDLTETSAVLSWPVAATGFRLQGNSGTDPGGWTDESGTPDVEDGRLVFRLPRRPGMNLFRLIK